MKCSSRHLGILGLAVLLAGGCATELSERDEYVRIHSMKLTPVTVPESELAQVPVIGVAVFTRPVYARLSPRGVMSDSQTPGDMDQ